MKQAISIALIALMTAAGCHSRSKPLSGPGYNMDALRAEAVPITDGNGGTVAVANVVGAEKRHLFGQDSTVTDVVIVLTDRNGNAIRNSDGTPVMKHVNSLGASQTSTGNQLLNPVGVAAAAALQRPAQFDSHDRTTLTGGSIGPISADNNAQNGGVDVRSSSSGQQTQQQTQLQKQTSRNYNRGGSANALGSASASNVTTEP